MIWILFSKANDYGQPDKAFEKVWFSPPTYPELLWWAKGKLGWEEEYHIEHLLDLVNGKTVKVDSEYWIEKFEKAPRNVVLVDYQYYSDQVKNSYLTERRETMLRRRSLTEREIIRALNVGDNHSLERCLMTFDSLKDKIEAMDAEIAFRNQEGWGLTKYQGRRL